MKKIILSIIVVFAAITFSTAQNNQVILVKNVKKESHPKSYKK